MAEVLQHQMAGRQPLLAAHQMVEARHLPTFTGGAWGSQVMAARRPLQAVMPLASLETSTSRQDRQPDLADQIAALSRSAAVFQNLPSLVTLAALSSTAGLLVRLLLLLVVRWLSLPGQVRQRPRAALAAQSALRLVLADLLWLAAH